MVRIAALAERQLVLGSGGLSRLSGPTSYARARIETYRRNGLWPPLVPTVVLTESISGRPRTDALINRFLKNCDVEPELPEHIARRAGELRASARQGSAVDAILVALAEPHGTVITVDREDLRTLAAHADDVAIEVV